MSKKLFVITGPSSAGLRDIISALFEKRDDIAPVLPVTARKMKAGETDGVGFKFYDLDGWNELKEKGDLLEQTVFAGNDYGTSRALVNDVLASGKHALINLEVERAAQIKKNMPEAVCIFVEPSDPEILKQRFSRTHRCSPLEITVRMQDADRQRELSGFCDARVDSNDEAKAIDEIGSIIDKA